MDRRPPAGAAPPPPPGGGPRQHARLVARSAHGLLRARPVRRDEPPRRGRGPPVGGALAAAYRDVDPDALFDFHLVDEYRQIVERLAAHADDAEFTAAFFAGIGSRRTVELPRRLRRILQENVDDAVRTVSRAFGSAVSGGPVVPGFAAVAAAVRARADRDEDRGSIGDLLSTGRLPTEWLAEVVVTQMFLPGDESNGATLTPYLRALSENPAAARLAIALATGDSPLPGTPRRCSPTWAEGATGGPAWWRSCGT